MSRFTLGEEADLLAVCRELRGHAMTRPFTTDEHGTRSYKLVTPHTPYRHYSGRRPSENRTYVQRRDLILWEASRRSEPPGMDDESAWDFVECAVVGSVFVSEQWGRWVRIPEGWTNEDCVKQFPELLN